MIAKLCLVVIILIISMLTVNAIHSSFCDVIAELCLCGDYFNHLNVNSKMPYRAASTMWWLSYVFVVIILINSMLTVKVVIILIISMLTVKCHTEQLLRCGC